MGRVRNDAAGIVVEYIYDGYGRLIKEIEQRPDGMVRSTIRLPMGNQTAYEKISEGTNTITRVYIPFGDKTIAKKESVNGGQAEVSFYHTDNLGSIGGVSGADSATFQYDPYGNTISGEQSEHNLGFTGKPHDSTGLYYFGARFYDPELGRFITVDPARDGLNWYVYCRNNPLLYKDVDGLACDIPITYYNQNNPEWGSIMYTTLKPGERGYEEQTIGKSGCGPTAAAIVISSLTNARVTPDIAASFAIENGFRTKNTGTYWGFIPAICAKYGLNVEPTDDIDKVCTALSSGNV